MKKRRRKLRRLSQRLLAQQDSLRPLSLAVPVVLLPQQPWLASCLQQYRYRELRRRYAV